MENCRFFQRLKSDQRPTDLRNLGASVVSFVLRVYKVILKGHLYQLWKRMTLPPRPLDLRGKGFKLCPGGM